MENFKSFLRECNKRLDNRYEIVVDEFTGTYMVYIRDQKCMLRYPFDERDVETPIAKINFLGGYEKIIEEDIIKVFKHLMDYAKEKGFLKDSKEYKIEILEYELNCCKNRNLTIQRTIDQLEKAIKDIQEQYKLNCDKIFKDHFFLEQPCFKAILNLGKENYETKLEELRSRIEINKINFKNNLNNIRNYQKELYKLQGNRPCKWCFW